MIAWLKKIVERMDLWYVGLIKWSVVAFVLFVITIWPAFLSWVQSVNPWYYLIAFLILVARPLYRIYIK